MLDYAYPIVCGSIPNKNTINNTTRKNHWYKSLLCLNEQIKLLYCKAKHYVFLPKTFIKKNNFANFLQHKRISYYFISGYIILFLATLKRYWPYWFFAIDSPASINCSFEIQPFIYAISSGQEIFKPWWSSKSLI